MRGLMMDRPLLIASLIEHADRFHPDTEIVSRTVEGPIHRYTYRDAHIRTRKLANALDRLNVKMGDRIATLAWNGYRHFETYFAVSGIGAVCHTINPRLFPEQITYIVNHAQDSFVFVDLTFVPLLEKLADKLPDVRGYIVMTDAAHMPQTSLPNALCYEDLIAAETGDYPWPEFDENTASSLCYTSGTTGNPKGVLYTHRSTVLHSFAACAVDGLALSANDVVLPIVPMFHVNAWGTPYAAAMSGAKLVFPGPAMDGASVQALIEQEQVSLTLGVPTVWLMLLNHLKESGKRIDTLKTVVIGGSAAPRSMIETFQNDYGVNVLHAWGMTELSPLGTVGRLMRKHENLPPEKKVDIQLKQGRGLYGVEMKIVDDQGNRLPHDGKAFGNLMVRGPWIAKAYFKGEGGEILDDEGFFPTGDVSTIDPDGYMQITDRSKDVIKSGGEWISSIDLENAAVGCAGVAEAAVIGIKHPKWDERPLLIIVRKAGSEVNKEEILGYLDGKIAKWWMPDDVVFVPEIPHTATGKILKTALRAQFKDYTFPAGSTAS